ncbi:ArsR/SmtB family transcription factor [Embleya sp. AB8]|uniref:ArsR/SmtB family transcription factor n=1 Tax=Embleya sp. AB8 TaxID=3156304 RepID=UPI003C73B0A1
MPAGREPELLDRPLPDAELATAVVVLRAVAGPIRLRLLLALQHRELSIGELTDRAHTHYAAVSANLACLRAAGLVTVRHNGPQALYRSTNPHVTTLVAAALEVTRQPPDPGTEPTNAGTEPRRTPTCDPSSAATPAPAQPSWA